MRLKYKIIQFMLWCGVLAFLWACIVIVATAKAYQPRVLNQPTWSPPDIPVCDLELWERIETQCVEKGNE